MKAPLFPLLAVLVTLTLPLHADPSVDLRSPKAENSLLLRVFLYVPGVPRLIDYPDVEKILNCDKDRITFETQDGHVISHNGPYTVIQPPNTISRGPSGGPRFFDIK